METPKGWYNASKKEREDMICKVCGNYARKVSGDFLVCVGAVIGKSGSIIMHLPSGKWSGLSMSFAQASASLIGMTTEQREDTILWLHEI